MRHLFKLMTLYVNTIIITFRAIIDNEVIHNFLFQFKIKEHNIVEVDIQSQDFRCFDEIALRIYKFHNFDVDVINQRNEKSSSQQKFLKIDMILRMSFLALSELALSIASHDIYLRSIER